MRYPLSLAVFLSLLAGGLLACSPAAGPPTAPSPSSAEPVAVRVATARSRQLADPLEVSASLLAVRRVSPGSKILGRIDRLAVREGEAVAKGALLARLEDRDLKAAVAQARAAVAMAEAQRDNATAMARRMRELEARGSATVKNREDAVAGELVAAAAVDQAAANLEAARVTLSYAEVRSPLAGWVVSRLAEEGDMALPGQPIFVIEDLSALEARAEIPESAMAGLVPGAAASVSVEALGRTYATVLSRLIPAGDSASRSFEARFPLPNDDGTLKSGLFARITLPRGSRQALMVERSAVRRRGQLQSILVVQDGKAALRFVETGRPDPAGDRIEIVSGLADGELYVVDPPARLADGSPVSASQDGV
jgi:RND family efflux transporter MFP subunit